MDDVELLTKSLQAAIQRTAKQAQNYEVEITNLTAEIIKLQAELEAKNSEIAALRDYVNNNRPEEKTKESK